MPGDVSKAEEGYPTTIWSEIERTRQADEAAVQRALDVILCKYYRPLKAHLVFRFRASEDQAADWLQSFV
jgi:hypothetical protein